MALMIGAPSSVEAVVQPGEPVGEGLGLGDAPVMVSAELSEQLPPVVWHTVPDGVRIVAVTVLVPRSAVAVVIVTVARPDASVVAFSDEVPPVPAVPPWIVPGPVSLKAIPTPVVGVPAASVVVAVKTVGLPPTTDAVAGVRVMVFVCAAAAVVVAVAVSRGSFVSMPGVGVVVRAVVWLTQTVTVSAPDLVPL